LNTVEISSRLSLEQPPRGGGDVDDDADDDDDGDVNFIEHLPRDTVDHGHTYLCRYGRHPKKSGRFKIERMDGADDDEEVDDGEEDEIDYEEEEEEEESEDDDEDDDEEEEIEDIISSIKKFIRTFHNGDYDAEFDDVLSFDRGVIPLVWSTQASYNKPDNWVERNRIGLENVKRQLQDCVDSVLKKQKFQFTVVA